MLFLRQELDCGKRVGRHELAKLGRQKLGYKKGRLMAGIGGELHDHPCPSFVFFVLKISVFRSPPLSFACFLTLVIAKGLTVTSSNSLAFYPLEESWWGL